MTEFELGLRERLRAIALPPAPESLADALEVLVTQPASRPRSRRWPVLMIGIAAILLLAASWLMQVATIGGPGVDENETARPRAVASKPVARPTPTGYAFPDEIGGQRVYSVSGLLADRAAGRIDGPVLVAGYWTPSWIMHSCGAPDSNPGDLEIYCHDREYGITERDELAMTLLDPSGRVRPASGPLITPWVPSDVEGVDGLLPRAPIHGQPFPPIPIIVRGHLDDPLAAECRKAARQLCRDRLVIDEVVALVVDAVETPDITPSPSPFPFDSPPPIALDLESCRSVAGDGAFSFVGWMPGPDFDELIGDQGPSANGSTMAVAVTRDPVVLATRREHGRRYRLMGRSVCFTHEWEGPTVTGFASVAGSLYRLYDDGTVVPTDSSFR